MCCSTVLCDCLEEAAAVKFERQVLSTNAVVRCDKALMNSIDIIHRTPAWESQGFLSICSIGEDS